MAASIALAASAGDADAAPGEETRWVTQVVDLYPSVSPDGKKLAFHSTRLGAERLFVSDLNGNGARPIPGEGFRITPVWSPDGSRIAFVGDFGGQLDIFTMNADGSAVRRLTTDPGADIHPHWSADGRRIFFNSQRPRNSARAASPPNIFSMNADGSALAVHSNCSADCTYPVPSPDGARIVYRKEFVRFGLDWDLGPSSTDSEIVVTDLDGSNERNLSNNAAFDGWPIWSPDGRWILFSSNRAGPANVGQIFAVRPDGTGLRQLTGGPWSHAQPSFSPDGRTVFVYRLQEGSAFQFGFIGSFPVPDDML